jgi:hypothetical protein
MFFLVVTIYGSPNFHETEKKVLTPLILSGFLSQEQEEDKFSDLVAFASSMVRFHFATAPF